MKIDQYTPVIIPTLCRYEHFKRCVESLSKCTGADKTELYIGLDYPAKKEHESGYQSIKSFIQEIKGFKEVHVIEHKVNVGTGINNKTLLEAVSQKFDTYIYSEDDNEFAPNFLEYINYGLQKYKDNPNVVAICGYSYPQEDYPLLDYEKNIYAIKGYVAWGVGIWINKKEQYKKTANPKYIKELLHSIKKVFKLFRLGYHKTIHDLIYRNTRAYGDLMWRVYCGLNDKYCIFPRVSKVRNWGFDGSGNNCANLDKYTSQPIDSEKYFVYDEIEIKEDPNVIILRKKLCNGSWKLRRIGELEYLIFRLTGKALGETKIGSKIRKKRAEKIRRKCKSSSERK